MLTQQVWLLMKQSLAIYSSHPSVPSQSGKRMHLWWILILLFSILCLPISSNGARNKRSLSKPLAKVLAKGAKTGLRMGSASFKILREAASKEAASGGYLTDKFLTLIYYPHLLTIEGEIADLHQSNTREMEERGKTLLALLILASAVPLLALLLAGFQLYIWTCIRKMKEVMADLENCTAACVNGGKGTRSQGCL